MHVKHGINAKLINLISSNENSFSLLLLPLFLPADDQLTDVFALSVLYEEI